MNVVISDPKTGKAYSKKIEGAGPFMGRKVGEEVELATMGLEGYTAKIRGGSDKQGFPMKHDLPGDVRKKIYTRVSGRKGMMKRISRRGNTVSEETSQLNLAVTKHGPKPLNQLIEKVEKKEDVSEKEKVVKDLKAGGKISAQHAKEAVEALKKKEDE